MDCNSELPDGVDFPCMEGFFRRDRIVEIRILKNRRCITIDEDGIENEYTIKSMTDSVLEISNGYITRKIVITQ